MREVFITGGTGFLGAEIIREILETTDDCVHALVRGKSDEDAQARMVDALRDVYEPEVLGEDKLARVKAYCGDITQEGLGLSENDTEALVGKVNVIYNSAAITDLVLPIEEIRVVNVNGTRNVLDFAVACKEKGSLQKVNHISTAYVVGTKEGAMKEDDLNVGQGFNNSYEQSKYEAELLVNEYREKGVTVDIFRPSIILGRYGDGKTTNFKMFYQPLHFFAMELFHRIPAAKESRANLINIDITAKAIVRIDATSENMNMNYHIASPEMPDLRTILDFASNFFGYPKLEFVERTSFDWAKECSPVKWKMIEPFVPYFNYLVDLDMTNTTNALSNTNFLFPSFDENNFTKLFEYCAAEGFIKRKQDAVTG